MLFIGQDIGRQRQMTLDEDVDQTVLAQGADQTREGHGGEMADDRAQLQTQSTMCGQQRITGHLRAHLAVAQDEMWQDGEHRTTRGALDPPDGDSTQADTDIMRVARQTSTPTTGGFVFQLKAEGQHEGEDTFEERLAIVKQLHGGLFSLKIDGDGPVFARLAGCGSHGHPQKSCA
jgi:hypothetical protein